MRTDILDLAAFYDRPLGAAAAAFIGARLGEAWGDAAGLRVAGFGHASPYLGAFDRAERVIALAPGGQGAMRWPAEGRNRVCLSGEENWPLPDSSIDRLLIVHGLEESPDARRLLHEAWRVLAPAGRLIVVAAHRRGLWSMIDSTPFAAGRPFLRRQLYALLEEASFRRRYWSGALYFPPFGARLFLRAAPAIERAGALLWPAFAGVVLVEAEKLIGAPVGLVRRAAARERAPAQPQPARPATARVGGARLLSRPPLYPAGAPDDRMKR